MAVTQTSRLGVYRWTEGTDTFTRAQMDKSHENLEDRAGVFLSGSGTPPAATPNDARGLYLNTTSKALYYSDGSTWRLLGNPGTPVALTPGNATAAGTALTLARSDHVHGLPAFAAPVSVSTANVAGSATTFARSDHQHAVAAGAIGATALASNAVTTAKIADLAVTTAKIADNAVTTPKIVDLAITTAKLANLGVTTGKIADLGVTTAKIADLAVTTAKIADLGVTTAKIAAKAVTTAKIADAAIERLQIRDGEVIADKIATGAITAVKIATDAVTTVKIVNLAVTTDKIADLAVTNAKINNGSINTVKLSDLSISTAKIIDAAVTTAKIADGSVTATKIATDAITTAKIATGAVTATEIATGAVTGGAAGKIALNTITTDNIADGAITLEKLDSTVTTPAGLVYPYAGIALPTGYLWCDGAAVSRTTYSDLFAALTLSKGSVTITIGTTHTFTTAAAHGLGAGDSIFFTTGGNLPAPLQQNFPYYVVNPTTTTFQVSLTRNAQTGAPGTAIGQSGSIQNGIHTLYLAPHGVSDGTTFNLPDMRGRVPMGSDSLGTQGDAGRIAGLGATNGITAALGFGGGAQVHVLTTSELASHNHTQATHTHTNTPHTHTQLAHSHGQHVTANPNTGGSGIRADWDFDAFGLNPYPQGVNTLNATAENLTTSIVIADAQPLIANTGGGVGHNNLSPFLTIKYIIKT